MLECGTGLGALPVSDLLDAAVALSPEYPVAAAEFAEVAWRAGRPADAVAVMTAVLEATPDQLVYADRRALVHCLRMAAAVDAAAAAGADTAALAGELLAAMSRVSPKNGDGDDSYQAQILRQINARLTVRSLLGGVQPPGERLEETESGKTSAPGIAVDFSVALRWRADRLAVESKALMTSGQRSAATASYVRAFAGLCDVAVRLLRYDAAELDGDSGAGRARVSAARRARQYAAQLERDLASDDPIGSQLVAAFNAVAAVTAGEQVAPLLAGWATMLLPMLMVEGPRRRVGRGISATSGAQQVSEHEREPVAVVLASVDGRLVTGPQVLKPGTVYTLRLDVRLEAWPEWADYLDAELVSHLNEVEAETPTFRWRRPGSDTRGEGPLIAEGTLILRFGLPAGRPAPPFLVVLRFRGTQEGRPFQQLCDVAGHVELRLRPFDATRDERLTQYSVVDERLLQLYERLHGAGYDEDQVQAFCRLLTAVCRAGLSMTWEKRYRRGQRVSERSFHDDLYARLLQDPELCGRVERGTPSALGYLDVRHDGITAELKVERRTPVTEESVPKYMGQATQYAAADGARLSILCILDMSSKTSPVGTAENYLWQIEPALHGLTNPEAPSVVTAVVVNGNLPPPSSWSRRRIPIQSRSKPNTR